MVVRDDDCSTFAALDAIARWSTRLRPLVATNRVASPGGAPLPHFAEQSDSAGISTALAGSGPRRSTRHRLLKHRSRRRRDDLHAGEMNGAPPVPVRIGPQLQGRSGHDEPFAIYNPDQLMQADRTVTVAAARRPIAVTHNDEGCCTRAETPGDLPARSRRRIRLPTPCRNSRAKGQRDAATGASGHEATDKVTCGSGRGFGHRRERPQARCER